MAAEVGAIPSDALGGFTVPWAQLGLELDGGCGVVFPPPSASMPGAEGLIGPAPRVGRLGQSGDSS